MKFGVSTLLWVSHWTDEDLPLLQKCRALGFDSVEIPLFDLNFDPGLLRQALAAQGLQAGGCIALGPETDIASDQAEIRAAGISFLQQCIDKVYAFGGSGIGGPMTTAWCKNPKRPANEAEWRWASSALRQLGGYAGEKDITLYVEPVNRFETYFINTVAQGAELIERAGQPNLKVLADLFHMNIEEKDICGALRAHRDYIAYIHCAENDRGMLGTGHIDWKSVFDTLGEIEFDGTVAIETFVLEQPDLAPATNTWRRLAPNADVLAARGLDFLRKVAAPTRTATAHGAVATNPNIGGTK